MLDLIVAKAMAKLLDDRYQTIKEFGDDLREVRRQIDSARPATALQGDHRAAAGARSRPIAVPERMVDTATMPLDADPKREGRRSAQGASRSPKTFDSFDATLRLAAMTDQTEDFRDYITATQKMRAYRGKIEAGSPLAPKRRRREPLGRPAPRLAPAEPDAPTRRTARRKHDRQRGDRDPALAAVGRDRR